MVVQSRTPLVREYLEDHQGMAHLFYQVIVALDEGESTRAQELAKELNRVIGPQIAYEELELYPRLSASQNSLSLCDDLQQVTQALKMLLEHDSLEGEDEQLAMEGLRIGLDHAEQCRALVGSLAALTESEQATSLEALRDLKRRGQCWVEPT